MKRYLLGGMCLLACSYLTPAQSRPAATASQKATPCSLFRTPVIAAAEDLDKAMLVNEKNRTVIARGKVIDPCKHNPQLMLSEEARKRALELEIKRKAKLLQLPLPGEPAPPPVKLKSTVEMLQDSLKLKPPTKP